jgi:taurine--2-oxoglutarate transaminase
MTTQRLSTQQIKEYDRAHNLHSWSKQGAIQPLVITKAEGIYFWDAEGNKYFDMSSQLVNMNLGHGNAHVVDAIVHQAKEMAFMGPGYAVEPRSHLAKKLLEYAPANMQKVFFTNAGADANENAIKMARMVTGRNKIFSRYRSYHGSSYGAGNLTGEPRRYPLEPGIPGFIKFFDPYLYRAPIDFKTEEEASKYYVNQLREQVIYEGPNHVAAIVLESVTGSNGVIIPPKGYMKGIREICDEFGIFMICDEVMTGFGRTGKWFGIQNFDGVNPDMITFAKGVTCGYVPLGGVLVTEPIASYFNENKLLCGLTYSGHPLGCAAGIATIEEYERLGLIERAKEMEGVLGKHLEKQKEKHPCVGDVRYIGLFSAVELVKDKASKEPLVAYGKDPEGVMPSIVGALKKRGFSTYAHENMIIVAPPLIITKEELEMAMNLLDEVLSEVDQSIL